MYKVVIVDDEPSMLDSISRILSKNPFFEIVGSAYMVSEAKNIIRENPPDVLFTDIKMPGGSGLGLLQYVSQNFPRCVMVVISGYDDFKYVRDSFIYGVEDYLLKPVSPGEFIPFLDRLAVKLDNDNKLLKDETIELEISTGDNAENMLVSEKMVMDIEGYIEANIEKTNSISEICKAFSISQPYLSKIFRQQKACSYNEFLASVRIAKAKKLLNGNPDLLIGTVATLSGFSDQFYFSKVFKNVVGVAPSEYRAKNR